MEYVVFDFDGPIFDGRKAAAEAIDNTIKNFEGKFPRPSLQNSALPLFGPKRLISLLYPGLELADREPVCTFYRQQLHEIERRLEVTNEVRSALDALRSAGFELAIYSMRNLDELDALLKAFGLRQNFCSLGCSPQFSKPSGDYFRFLSEKQNTSLTNLLY